jgi:hypothetical protein
VTPAGCVVVAARSCCALCQTPLEVPRRVARLANRRRILWDQREAEARRCAD